MSGLKSFSKNKYFSQFGEDGIIEEILDRLSKHITLDKWCSEFGAWDGVYLSNTCYFIKEKQYRAILIEGDKSKISDLERNFPQDEIHKVNKLVSFDGRNSLENIFDKYKIPSNFDFLSIDVDGVDYYILKSLNHYKPKVICIEFNPTMPNVVDFVQSKDMAVKQGCSARALVRLGTEKGYSLIASTDCNLIFIDSNLSKYVIETLPTLEQLNESGNDATYLFSGYDGTLLSNKNKIDLVWHSTNVSMSEIQYFPSILRKYFGDYNLLHKFIFILHRSLKKVLKY